MGWVVVVVALLLLCPVASFFSSLFWDTFVRLVRLLNNFVDVKARQLCLVVVSRHKSVIVVWCTGRIDQEMAELQHVDLRS